MDIEETEQLIHLISKGDISSAAILFNKPGGRKYLESVVLIVVSQLPCPDEEKASVFSVFTKGLDRIEKRIEHQKEGRKILRQIFS